MNWNSDNTLNYALKLVAWLLWLWHAGRQYSGRISEEGAVEAARKERDIGSLVVQDDDRLNSDLLQLR